MIFLERRERIKDILYVKKSVSVTDLAETLSVSNETIRRDLSVLEKEGFLAKSYGGATLASRPNDFVPSNPSSHLLVQEIKKIAKYAATLIVPGNSIFIDHTTTAHYLCDEIENMNLTVITNSLTVCNRLAGSETIKLICPGGSYHPKYNAFFGINAHKNLSDYFVNVCFFSPHALDVKRGIYDRFELEADFHRTVSSISEKTILLADHSKFDKSSFVRAYKDFSDIDMLITDTPLSSEWTERLNGSVPYFDFSDKLLQGE